MSKQIFTFLIVVISLLLLDGCVRIPKNDVEETIIKGNILINAAESFYKDKGVFPETLDLLRPKYLESIPSPDIGSDWNYKTYDNGNRFYISFSDPAGAFTYYYMSNKPELEWQENVLSNAPKIYE